MAGRIFLSYRREESGGQAGRLSDRLVPEFGRENLFLDIDSIPLGVDFVKRLTAEVAACDVLIAVIGPHWLEIRNECNERRIDQPNDFVRVEIAAALQRDIPVIPVLVDGAKIPPQDLLPENIKDLAVRNGTELRHASFHVDADRLIRELHKILAPPVPPSHQPVSPKENWLQELNTLIAKSKDQPRASIEIHRNLIEQIKIFAILRMSDGDWIAAALNKALRSKIYTADVLKYMRTLLFRVDAIADDADDEDVKGFISSVNTIIEEGLEQLS